MRAGDQELNLGVESRSGAKWRKSCMQCSIILKLRDSASTRWTQKHESSDITSDDFYGSSDISSDDFYGSSEQTSDNIGRHKANPKT